MVEIYGYSIATIPAIVALVYGAIELLKLVAFNGKEHLMRFIPVIAGVIGAVFGIAAFFAFPALVPVAEWWSAALMGLASGLSAVGVNQIKKQGEKGGNADGS